WGRFEAASQECLQLGAGLGPLGVNSSVDGHGEPVAAGVDEPFEDGLELVGALGAAVRSLYCGLVGAAESVLVIVVGAFESGEAGDVGVDTGLLEHQRV